MDEAGAGDREWVRLAHDPLTRHDDEVTVRGNGELVDLEGAEGGGGLGLSRLEDLIRVLRGHR